MAPKSLFFNDHALGIKFPACEKLVASSEILCGVMGAENVGPQKRECLTLPVAEKAFQRGRLGPGAWTTGSSFPAGEERGGEGILGRGNSQEEHKMCDVLGNCKL